MFSHSGAQRRSPNHSTNASLTSKRDCANNNNERPLSVYDNLTTIPVINADDASDHHHQQQHDNRIPFMFDDLLHNAMPTTTTTPTTKTGALTSSHHKNHSVNTTVRRVTDIDVDPPRYTPTVASPPSTPGTSQTPRPYQQLQPHHQHHHHDHQHHHRQHQEQPIVSTPVVASLSSSAAAAAAPAPEATAASAPPPPTAQYENVVETIKLRNSFRQQQAAAAAAAAAAKPAISDAKSTFFGLPTSSVSSTAAPAITASTANAPQSTGSSTLPPLYSMPHQQQQQQARMPSSRSAVAVAGQSLISDRSPLIDETPPAHTSPLAAKSNGEYQNIPSNSALFQQQQQQPPPRESPVVDVSSPNFSELVPVLTADEQLAGGGKHYMLEANRRISEQHTPSQAVYMSTTVPQNIKGSNIAGRHTPTRTSLRHSRMIVVNKNYQAPRQPNPLQLTHPLLAKLLLGVQLCCGLLISCLSVWVLLWAPNTRTRDNPYWSGLLLIVAAVLALVLVQFRRQPRQKLREHCYTFLRLNSTTLSLLATVVAFAAFLFASLHLDNVTSKETVCMPADVFSSSNAVCICLFGSSGAAAQANATAAVRPLDGGGLTADGLEFQYRDLSCTEVRGAWKYILFAFTLLNMIAFIVSFLYLMMLCCPRRGHKPRRRPSDARTGNGNGSAVGGSGSYAPVRSAL